MLCLQIGTLRARDPKTEDFVLLGMLLLQICNLLLHANFHDPMTILAAAFPQKTMKMMGFARFAHKCALRTHDPKTEDVISLATHISSFMPIIMTLRQF